MPNPLFDWADTVIVFDEVAYEDETCGLCAESYYDCRCDDDEGDDEGED